MKTYMIEVTQLVEVNLDETKFTDEFMEEFRESFFQYDTIEEHSEHIGQLVARGIHEPTKHSPEFIEGYGPSNEMGITARVVETDIDLVRT